MIRVSVSRNVIIIIIIHKSRKIINISFWIFELALLTKARFQQQKENKYNDHFRSKLVILNPQKSFYFFGFFKSLRKIIFVKIKFFMEYSMESSMENSLGHFWLKMKINLSKLLSYRTIRLVDVFDWRLGLIHYLCQLVIVGYIIIKVLVLSKGYQINGYGQGVTNLKAKGNFHPIFF